MAIQDSRFEVQEKDSFYAAELLAAERKQRSDVREGRMSDVQAWLKLRPAGGCPGFAKASPGRRISGALRVLEKIM
jgi:hypothetical protein